MFGNFIIGKVHKALIEVVPEENEATIILHHYMGSSNDNMDKYESNYQKNIELLCTAVNLIQYLKKHNLVYDYGIFPKKEFVKKFHLGFHPHPETGGVNWKIEDPELVKNIVEISKRVFLPTTDLIEIVKNKYRTHDEVKFNKQMLATWVSIGMAMFFGIYGIFK